MSKTTPLMTGALNNKTVGSFSYVSRLGVAGDPAALAGRWLNARAYTAILYLNDSWCPSHGGCLRLHGVHGTAGGKDRMPPASSSSTSSPSYVDVEPTAGRLVVFSSRETVHEVLPMRGGGEDASRFALTLWILDPNLPLEG